MNSVKSLFDEYCSLTGRPAATISVAEFLALRSAAGRGLATDSPQALQLSEAKLLGASSKEPALCGGKAEDAARKQKNPAFPAKPSGPPGALAMLKSIPG